MLDARCLMALSVKERRREVILGKDLNYSTGTRAVALSTLVPFPASLLSLNSLTTRSLPHSQTLSGSLVHLLFPFRIYRLPIIVRYWPMLHMLNMLHMAPCSFHPFSSTTHPCLTPCLTPFTPPLNHPLSSLATSVIP